MNSYDLNSLVVLSATFQRVDNDAPIDPTTVRLYVMEPDGVEWTVTYPGDERLVKDSEGNYHFDLACRMHGTWRYKFEGDGAVIAGTPDQSFSISESDLVGSSWPTAAFLQGIGSVSAAAQVA